MPRKAILLVLAIAVAAGSAYLLFRTVLQQSEHPITFELFAALIGVSITIVLTGKQPPNCGKKRISYFSTRR